MRVGTPGPNAVAFHESYSFVERSTPLGNPYVMRSEYDREAVCDAYHALLLETMGRPDGDAPSRAHVVALGVWCGFRGEVCDWDFRGARKMMGWLRWLWHQHAGDLVLLCGPRCKGLRCHAESIADFLNAPQPIVFRAFSPAPVVTPHVTLAEVPHAFCFRPLSDSGEDAEFSPDPDCDSRGVAMSPWDYE